MPITCICSGWDQQYNCPTIFNQRKELIIKGKSLSLRSSDPEDDQDLELIIRKNRDGSLGTDNFVFEKGIQKLTEIGDTSV